MVKDAIISGMCMLTKISHNKQILNIVVEVKGLIYNYFEPFLLGILYI